MRKLIKIVDFPAKKQDIYIEISKERFTQLLYGHAMNKRIVLRVDDVDFILEHPKIQGITQSESLGSRSLTSKISEFKEYQDPKWKNEILNNLNDAINRRNREYLIKKIAEDWKYKNNNTKGVEQILDGKQGFIRAEEILLLEDLYGIHRDEILGATPISDRQIYRHIELLIKQHPDDKNDIVGCFRSVVKFFNRQKYQPGFISMGQVANQIKNKL